MVIHGKAKLEGCRLPLRRCHKGRRLYMVYEVYRLVIIQPYRRGVFVQIRLRGVFHGAFRDNAVYHVQLVYVAVVFLALILLHVAVEHAYDGVFALVKKAVCFVRIGGIVPFHSGVNIVRVVVVLLWLTVVKGELQRIAKLPAVKLSHGRAYDAYPFARVIFFPRKGASL